MKQHTSNSTLVALVAFLTVVALPLTVGCSSDDSYYNRKAIAASDSLEGYWIGDESQTWWFLEKGDTSAYHHTIASTMMKFHYNTGSQTDGTCELYEYEPLRGEWKQLGSFSFNTDNDDVFLKESDDKTDTLKLLNFIGEYLTYSISGPDYTSNVVFVKLDTPPSSITPQFNEFDFYDDEESSPQGNFIGYWKLNYVADYDPSNDEIGPLTDVSSHGLSMNFRDGMYEVFSIDDATSLMSGEFSVNGNKLSLTQEKRQTSDDETANTVMEALAKGAVIEEFGTDADDYTSYVHFNLIVSEGNKDRLYCFEWSHGSMSSRMKDLQDIIDKYKK